LFKENLKEPTTKKVNKKYAKGAINESRQEPKRNTEPNRTYQ